MDYTDFTEGNWNRSLRPVGITQTTQTEGDGNHSLRPVGISQIAQIGWEGNHGLLGGNAKPVV